MFKSINLMNRRLIKLIIIFTVLSCSITFHTQAEVLETITLSIKETSNSKVGNDENLPLKCVVFKDEIGVVYSSGTAHFDFDAASNAVNFKGRQFTANVLLGDEVSGFRAINISDANNPKVSSNSFEGVSSTSTSTITGRWYNQRTPSFQGTYVLTIRNPSAVCTYTRSLWGGNKASGTTISDAEAEVDIINSFTGVVKGVVIDAAKSRNALRVTNRTASGGVRG
jgi:hypothetical protein